MIKKLQHIYETLNPLELLTWFNKYYFKTIRYRPLIIKEGHGIVFKDLNGEEYIDFISMGACTNLGFNNPKVIQAIKEQLDDFTSATLSNLSVPAIRLARLLAEIAPKGLTRSMVLTSGTDGCETAIKVAKRIRGNKIIGLWGGFHGSTGAYTLAAGGTLLFKSAYDPNLPGFLHVSPPYCYRCDFGQSYPDCNLTCAEIIDHVIKYEDPKQMAAVIMEPLIGGGGIVIPPRDYLPRVREICNKHGTYLIFDEVLLGFGRTGKMFFCQHYDTTPDMMFAAKGITSTYIPAGVLMVSEKVAEALGVAPEFTDAYEQRGVSGQTNRFHPLACAAALANLKVILEEKLVDNAAKVGEYMHNYLEEIAETYEFLGEVRGKGFVAAVEVIKDATSREPWPEKSRQIVSLSLKRRLLISQSYRRLRESSTILMYPALITTKKDVDKALGIFEQSVKEAAHSS